VEHITFRCACCRRIRPRNLRAKNQRYCGDKRCQQARKSKWQREKLQTDPDYRTNKKESQQVWKQKNPDYWKRYRRQHPEYCLHNRQMQRIRDQCRQMSASCENNLVKMDALNLFLNDNTGSYFICPADSNLVKRDALAVKIIPISAGYKHLAKKDSIAPQSMLRYGKS
jgi:hypothetical protein